MAESRDYANPIIYSVQMYPNTTRNRKRKDARRNPESIFLASSRWQCSWAEIGTSGESSCAAGEAGAAAGMGRSAEGQGRGPGRGEDAGQ